MNKRTKILIVIGIALVAALLAASAIRYQMVVVPSIEAAEEQAAEDEQVEESSESEKENTESKSKNKTLAGNVRLGDGMSAALADMYQLRWESPEAGTVLLFSEGEVRILEDGREERCEQFSITETMELLPSDSSTYGSIASVNIGDDEMLMWVNIIPISSIKPDLGIKAIPVNPAAPGTTECITFSGFYNKPFYPVEEHEFKVITSDAGKKLLGDDAKTADERIESFARAMYPSATTASFTDTAMLDLSKGIYAFYYVLNDPSSSEITLIYTEGEHGLVVQQGHVDDLGKTETR